MSSPVADRVTHKLPRPIHCNVCGGPRVHLQKRSLMRMKAPQEWDLVWHCLDCLALVGCHKGTDIPLGLMADSQTREARFLAHQEFDRLWRRGRMTRTEAYAWMAKTLNMSLDAAHIGMLDEKQCLALIAAVKDYQHTKRHERHWKQKNRKRRRK